MRTGNNWRPGPPRPLGGARLAFRFRSGCTDQPQRAGLERFPVRFGVWGIVADRKRDFQPEGFTSKITFGLGQPASSNSHLSAVFTSVTKIDSPRGSPQGE